MRHELVGGFPYAMAGASKAHNLLVQNPAYLLRDSVRKEGCRLCVETVKLCLGEDTVYYPDLMVAFTGRGKGGFGLQVGWER